MRKGIGTFICSDCSGPKKALVSKRCYSCANTGENHPLFGMVPWNKGKIDCYSKETRVAMGFSNRGKRNHNFGKASWNRGKEDSEITLQRKSGSNNPAWNGGKSFEVYPQEFNRKLKEMIRDRDGHICQVCRVKEGIKRHPVHHIDYNKEHNWPSNLTELCIGCNASVNVNRKRWEEYFRLIRAGEYLSPEIFSAVEARVV